MSRASMRAARRFPAPAPIEPAAPRLKGANSRPRHMRASEHQQSRYGLAILTGMGTTARRGEQIYGGTVPHAVVRDRRRRNKSARQARKMHRRAARR